MTATESPAFSSAVTAASAKLAEASRELRLDPRIGEVYEGTDIEVWEEGANVSTYLDLLIHGGPTVSWILDGTVTAKHWNLEGSVRMDPDGNGQRAVKRFSVRQGEQPEEFANALRAATTALIRSASSFDTMGALGRTNPKLPKAARGPAAGVRHASRPASDAGRFSKPHETPAPQVRVREGLTAATPRRPVSIKRSTNGTSRLLDANTVGTGLASRALPVEAREHRGGGRSPYRVTLVLDRIVVAADLMEALQKARALGLGEIVSIIELA